MRSAVSVEKSTAGRVSVWRVATSMPRRISRTPVDGAVSQKVSSAVAGTAGRGRAPMSSRNFRKSRSGTSFSRYSRMSVIHANSSISITPGSLTLWSVHSGQYSGIRRLASSTRSWNVRGSIAGAGTLALTWNQIERIDQVAFGVGGSDPVADVDDQQAILVTVRFDVAAGDFDARLPPAERLQNLRLNESGGGRVVGRKRQIVDAAAKLWPHTPLAFGRGQDIADRP